MQSKNTPSLSLNPPILPRIEPLFATKTKWRCLTLSDISFINKRKPKMLKTLEIAGSNDSRIGSHGIRHLRRALLDAKIVSSLIIGKDDWIDVFQPKNNPRSLLNAFSRCKRLLLRFQYIPDLDENATKTLIRLRRWKDLSSLKIHFCCYEEPKIKILRSLSQQMRGLAKLKILHLDITNCKSAGVGYDPNTSLFQFKYPRCLSSLTLNFQSATLVQQELVSIFISNLQRCHQLKSLNFDSHGLFLRQTLSLSMIWGPLFKNQNLQSLTLLVCFSDRNIHPFLDGFSHLKKLTALDLYMYSELSANQFQIFITTLYNHLASFPNFKSLTLRISTMKNSYSEFGALFSQIQSLTKLEELEINFPVVTDVSKSHLQSLSQALQFLHCLKKLHLNFPTQKISLEGINSVTKSLKNLNYLPDLSLQFPFANLDNKSIQIISDSVVHLPLNNLRLHLGQSNTNFLTNLWKGKPKLTSLFSTLENSHLLTCLDLNLSAFKLSTSEAKEFSLTMKKLQQLCTLSITLSEFDTENKYEGLQSFFESFKEIPHISSLTIHFTGENIGDEGVRFLAENLQGLQCLRTLILGFKEVNHISEDSMHDLSIALKGLFLLKELQVFFSAEIEMRSELIVELLESLATLKYLESLRLELSPQVYSFEIREFTKTLLKQQQSFKRLTHLVLHYDRIL